MFCTFLLSFSKTSEARHKAKVIFIISLPLLLFRLLFFPQQLLNLAHFCCSYKGSFFQKLKKNT